MKKLLLTILLNVLLLPVVGWGGVHGCNSCEEWTSSETLGLQPKTPKGVELSGAKSERARGITLRFKPE